jgi:hypothetical protein
MLRTSVLIVDVFIDVDDDGTVSAEAVLLRAGDQHLLASGRARCAPDGRGRPAVNENVAAQALIELTGELQRVVVPPAPGDDTPPPAAAPDQTRNADIGAC